MRKGEGKGKCGSREKEMENVGREKGREGGKRKKGEKREGGGRGGEDEEGRGKREEKK
jgi:hypothetical protein